MRFEAHSILIAMSAAGLLLGASPANSTAKNPPAFDSTVQPILAKTCAPCHNERMASGGLNLGVFSTAASVNEQREGWERILQKIRTGEMPPKGIPRPSAAESDALVNFVEGEFDKADRNVKPDPGRVTAHRLNRNEYSNTIRDLLASISAPRKTSRPTIPATASTISATSSPSRRC